MHRRPVLSDDWKHRLLGMQCRDLRHNDWGLGDDELLGVRLRPVLNDDREYAVHRVRCGDIRFRNGSVDEH
jgi:hypothetical protein